METNKLLFAAAAAGVVWYLYDQDQKKKENNRLFFTETKALPLQETPKVSVVKTPSLPLPVTKEEAEGQVADVQSALRRGDPAPLNAMLTQLLPSSTAGFATPTASQQLVGEAFAMPLMGRGMMLMSGKVLPGIELDYTIDMAKTILRHPKVRKLARQQLKIKGRGPLDLADMAEQQAKEQIEKGVLTQATIKEGRSQMTPSHKLSVAQILNRSKQRGLLKRIPAIPGYNITFSEFVKRFNVKPGSKAQQPAEMELDLLGCPLALANPLSGAFSRPVSWGR